MKRSDRKCNVLDITYFSEVLQRWKKVPHRSEIFSHLLVGDMDVYRYVFFCFLLKSGDDLNLAHKLLFLGSD